MKKLRMIVTWKKLAVIALSLMVLASCNHDDDIFEGPSLEDQYGEFGIVTPLSYTISPIDFSTGQEMVFYSELTINTTWIIEITGLSSGARKVITDNNKIIGPENATWNGGATGFPAFSKERCAIEMTFPDKSNDTIRDTIEISGLKGEDASATLVANFESGFGSSWETWSQATVNQEILCNDNNAAKGDCYYSMGGVVGWDWGIGNVVFRDSTGDGFGLTSNSNAVYFNCALKGVNSVGSSIMLFRFEEDDNGDGIFDPQTEDTWEFLYDINSAEWELVSFQYAEMSTDENGAPVETQGNGVLEPHKLHSVIAFLLADPQQGEVTTYLDQILFTVNGPYEP